MFKSILLTNENRGFFSSSLLLKVFLCAHKEGKRFRVIVADGRPRFEGREMLRQLVNAGIECSYIQVSAVPYVVPEVRNVESFERPGKIWHFLNLR